MTQATTEIVPFSLKDAPALIERLLPVQKLSVEAYKEQMAVHGKTLTALGSYWKGRKPLILNKACILGCLLPATEKPARDLAIFEKLMAMDDESFVARWKRRPRPKEILAELSIARIDDFFEVDPPGILPRSSPVDWSNPTYKDVKVTWRKEFLEADEIERRKGNSPLSSLIPHPSSLLTRRQLEAQLLPDVSYRDRVDQARRPEEVMDAVHDHIWDAVNAHLGTSARSFPELTEQLGIMRFGHRPRVADTFCGSGQIPFEAARLGCDVYASDLNPIACMLTWGALNIVGGSPESRVRLAREQQELVRRVQEEIDALGVETDGKGWRAKVFLYCVETTCPQTGWSVPLLPSRVISKGYRVIAELVPDPESKRYEIQIRSGVTERELKAAEFGTVGRDSKYDEAYLIHKVDGTTYKTKISTLRGDFRDPDGSTGNRLRLWDRQDFMPRPDDLLQERLYCIQWARPKGKGRREEFEFRSVTEGDLIREDTVERFVRKNFSEWQRNGWIPDMRIEVGGPPRYQGLDLVKSRGWQYWHHLFNARQLMLAAQIRSRSASDMPFALGQVLNVNARLTRWNPSPGPGRAGATSTVFDNQALNTVFNYGCRASAAIASFFPPGYKSFPLLPGVKTYVFPQLASAFRKEADVFVTDPPYGDAVKYEEILDFFIAWLRKNPPPEFADWKWDSLRSHAIQGEGEDFRRRWSPPTSAWPTACPTTASRWSCSPTSPVPSGRTWPTSSGHRGCV